MKIKKPLTKLLCVSVVLSNIMPVLAATTETDESTYESAAENVSKETEVLYKQSASYFVTIPKTITLGSEKQSSYSVKVEGDIPSDRQVYVSPNDGIEGEGLDFYMKDQNAKAPKEDVVATITQGKLYWNFEDVAEGYRETNNQITATELSAGNWKGIFDFEINMHTYAEDSGSEHKHNYIDNTKIVPWINTANGDHAFIQEGTKWTSDNKGIKSSTAASTWTITLDKDAEYSFRYKVSSETKYDKLTITLDDAKIADGISGVGEEITYTVTLTAGTHTLTADYTKDSSGDRNDDCGYIILEDINESNHKCLVCQNEEAHIYEETIKENSCTEDGKRTYTCSMCGNSYTEIIAASGHNYGSGIVTKKADCIEAGEKTYTCSVCGDSYTEMIEASGHNVENGVCTICGEEDYVCLNWNYTLDDSNNIITLNYYTGSETDIVVDDNYVVDGKTYKTQIASNVEGATDKVPYMFNGLTQTNCKNIKTITFSKNIDTSSVTNMSYMFRSCLSLTRLDLSGFDTSRVADMRGMFSYCRKLNSLDISSFDTSSVTNMSYMFYGCQSLTGLNVSSFHTGNVMDMSGMFDDCKLLISIDLSNFDTGSVTSMSSMFWGCSSLTSLDLRSFSTSNITEMSGMFYDCAKLKSVFATENKWIIPNGCNTAAMFYNCGTSAVTYK